MNPKDMTNEDLFGACISAVRAWPDSRTTYEGDHLWATYTVTRAELLRRLDEAVALRNENEELRKIAIDAVFFATWADVSSMPLTMQTLRGEIIESCGKLGIYERRQAKESEASHD